MINYLHFDPRQFSQTSLSARSRASLFSSARLITVIFKALADLDLNTVRSKIPYMVDYRLSKKTLHE